VLEPPSDTEGSTAPAAASSPAAPPADGFTGAAAVWTVVPEAVLLLIMGQLSLRDVAAAACVCSSWCCAITATDDIWLQLERQLLSEFCEL
jgi:hypothetical protein